MSKVIGIDLGTTNSCVAIIEGGRPRVIENSEGERSTPAVAAFTRDGGVLVGQPARRQAAVDSRNTLFAIKRLFGRRFEDEGVQRDLKQLPYRIARAGNGDAWVETQGRMRAPAEICARVLLKMKKTAEDYVGERVTEAVITVPAHFSEAQRQAVRDAGRIAGLDVRRLINETIAAALAYDLEKQGPDRRIAVYAFGGGTFGISVIEVADVDGERQFEVLSSNGDTALGGLDFDIRLIRFLVAQYRRESGFDVRQDPLAMQRLKDAAEKAKIELSSAEHTRVNLPYIATDAAGPRHLEIPLTRTRLESLVEDLVKRTVAPCRTALKDAGVVPSEISEVILVGGQTRMPLVQRYVREIFGPEPRMDIIPGETVAVGAAIQAGVLEGHVKDVLLLDVVPLALGIETVGEDETPRLPEAPTAGSLTTVLIERNTTFPTKVQRTFSTVRNRQTAVMIHVLQGNYVRSAYNMSLGRLPFTALAPQRRGVPRIDVALDIDALGTLRVTAKDLATGREQQAVITADSGLSRDEVRRMTREVELRELIGSVEKLLMAMSGAIDATVRNEVDSALSELRGALTGQDWGSLDKRTEALTLALRNALAQLRR